MSERAFRIDPGAPVPDELRRVARGRIEHALDELRGESDSTRAPAASWATASTRPRTPASATSHASCRACATPT
jgi:hypothetical protein